MQLQNELGRKHPRPRERPVRCMYIRRGQEGGQGAGNGVNGVRGGQDGTGQLCPVGDEE